MTTDQKIREAYEQAVKNAPYISSLVVFTGGYIAEKSAFVLESEITPT